MSSKHAHSAQRWETRYLVNLYLAVAGIKDPAIRRAIFTEASTAARTDPPVSARMARLAQIYALTAPEDGARSPFDCGPEQAV